MSKRGKNIKKSAGKGRKHIVLIAVAAGIVIIAAVLLLCFKLFRICGDSMSPAYEDGDIVVTAKVFDRDSLDYGDVVCFNDIFREGKYLVKRVAALPGDTILITSGTIYVNGEVAMAELTENVLFDAGLAGEVYTVPEDCVFVLGDSLSTSWDSRQFGAVPFENITGLVLNN